MLRRGTPLDARGVTIGGSPIRRLLRALSGGETERPELPAIDFGGAVFTEEVDFRNAIFLADARFSEATFSGKAQFGGVTFRGDARFRDTTFAEDARFLKARFEKSLYCGDVKFLSAASFRAAQCLGPASYLRAEFGGPTVFADARFNENAKFIEAKFPSTAVFARVQFEGRAEFFFATFRDQMDARRAQFTGAARFDNTAFLSDTRFDNAVFASEAHFSGELAGTSNFQRTNFEGIASFGGMDFGGRADFTMAVVAGFANFSGTTFAGPARFGGVEFGGHAQFDGAIFKAGARFSGSVFRGDTRFSGTQCNEDARFGNAVFERTRVFGKLKVEGGLLFDGAVFNEHVRVEAEAKLLSGRGATFAEGAHIRVDSADVVLDDADFVRQSILVGRVGGEHRAPRLLGLRRAYVAPLVLSELDLRPCRFFGAHGLESMQVEESCVWATVPRHWWLSQRQAIAEEHQWRASSIGRDSKGSSGWYGEATRWPQTTDGDGDEARELEPLEIASLYRALRKAREDDKDEAGAGDMYYGEMEMRRRARSGLGQDESGPFASETAVLWAYWLSSGYGLRASRAVGSLLITLLISSALLCWFGFHPVDAHNFGRAFLFSVESSVSLLRPPHAAMSVGGQVVQVVLRLVGPLFVGLALLSVRSRIKR